MKKFTITKEHLDDENNYVGPDFSKIDSDIYSEPNLGWIKFSKVNVKLGIYLSNGTSGSFKLVLKVLYPD